MACDERLIDVGILIAQVCRKNARIVRAQTDNRFGQVAAVVNAQPVEQMMFAILVIITDSDIAGRHGFDGDAPPIQILQCFSLQIRHGVGINEIGFRGNHFPAILQRFIRIEYLNKLKTGQFELSSTTSDYHHFIIIDQEVGIDEINRESEFEKVASLMENDGIVPIIVMGDMKY